jgi:hypothetical protein
LRDLRILPTVEQETVKPSLPRRMVSLSFEEAGVPPGVSGSSYKLRGPLRLPYPFGSSGPVFKAFEVFGVELLLPPKGGALGYSYLAQVTATGWVWAKSRSQDESWQSCHLLELLDFVADFFSTW